MDLLCYVPKGWTFNIRPAEAKRDWMDRTADAFAYRCLPLNIANAHGWEVLSPSSFEALWNGGSNRADLTIRMIGQHEPAYAPVSLFGNGVLTIHMHGLFRTPPGWNLWVSGPPNLPKEGAYPLTGIVETDWSPYTFTMNWQITRPNQWIRFDKGEPVCFFFPVQRGLLESVEPRIVAFEKNPELLRQFNDWRESRDTFYKTLPAGSSTGDSWQKRYYRGVDMRDRCPVADHETKLRLKPFVSGDEPAQLKSPSASRADVAQPARREAAASPAQHEPGAAAPSAAVAEPSAIQRELQTIGVELMSGADPAPLVQRIVALGAPEREAQRIIGTAINDPLIINGRAMALALRQREWLLSGLERQRRLAPSAARIERRTDVSESTFLEQYYASSRPVVLLDLVSNWPALALWTPQYLLEKLGPCSVAARRGDDDAGVAREMPLASFVEILRSGRSGSEDVAVLDATTAPSWPARVDGDLGSLDPFLSGRASAEMCLSGPGARLQWRQSPRNGLLVQIAGRRHFALRAPGHDGDPVSVASRAGGKQPVEVSAAGSTRLAISDRPKAYELTLNPGEILFTPFGWWHEARSLDVGIGISFFDFKWPNDYPDCPSSL